MNEKLSQHLIELGKIIIELGYRIKENQVDKKQINVSFAMIEENIDVMKEENALDMISSELNINPIIIAQNKENLN